MRRRTLVDVLRGDLARDPGDAPALYVEADLAAQDMAWMPTGTAPAAAAGGVATAPGPAGLPSQG